MTPVPTDAVLDRHGVPIVAGTRVRTDWPGAVGTVTQVTDWDGDIEEGRVVGFPPRVHVCWDEPLTNAAGQVWQDEWCDTQQEMSWATYPDGGPDRCNELEVINERLRPLA